MFNIVKNLKPILEYPVGIGACVANYTRIKYLRDHINAVHKNIIAINYVSSSCENLENDPINDD